MANMTWHAGGQGDQLKIAVEWADHNNMQHKHTVLLTIENDKPRAFVVKVGGEEPELTIAEFIAQ